MGEKGWAEAEAEAEADWTEYRVASSRPNQKLELSNVIVVYCTIELINQ